ncbi:MAG: bifunctional acetate--CoA ligase family protein/GNAT family N-acetyltransferase [Lewinellaceae bacterium]|nr:bifunctional acetate--CoA ligase family protein/GNAT family N-acetyltransferase [Lewinellaceae bacterium]
MREKLEKILKPRSVAVIGASDRSGSLGQLVMANLVAGGFTGKIYPINLRHAMVQNVPAYRQVSKIPEPVDLAILCTRRETIPGLVEECGQAGIGGILLMGAGFGENDPQAVALVRKLCRKYGMRLLGPQSLGVINTHHHLNVSALSVSAIPGNLALISRSGPLLNAMLDWAQEQQIGFSHVISIGGMADIDFADLIDYLGADSRTASMLIYLENLPNARRFMSASRSFSRNKPIIVLKAGRQDGGERGTIVSHTEALVGGDAVYDAAFRRAGIIRVDTIAQLFNMAQATAWQPRPQGKHLAVITNTGAPGLLAADYLFRNGGQLAPLTEATYTQLRETLPEDWPATNPVHVGNTANADTYSAAIRICLQDSTVDGLMVIFSPLEGVDHVALAEAIGKAIRYANKPVLAVWMGEGSVAAGRAVLEKHRVPHYRYPESAVDVFLRMYRYGRDIQLIFETPATIPQDFQPDAVRARQLIDRVLAAGRATLFDHEARELVRCYGIPALENFLCHSPAEAIMHAQRIGFPVVMKVVSPEVIHKTDAGGILLNLRTAEEVGEAYDRLLRNVQQNVPHAKVLGVTVERMVRKGFELLLGARFDPVFGPVVVFGRGGIAVEVYKDFRMGLPPLNMALAQRIIEGTQIYPLLQGYRGQAGVDLNALAFWLYKFSYLLVDFPELHSIDINPFNLDEQEGMALDVQVVLNPQQKGNSGKPYQHLIISPYPGEQYSKTVTLKDGTSVWLRPIRPEDEPAMEAMLKHVSSNSLYMRFFGYIPKVTHTWLTRFTHIDYDREIAIIAEVEAVKGQRREMIGVVRIIEDAWRESAEYSILVADHWHGKGIGNLLTDHILDIARKRDIPKIVASVLPHNTPMVHMFERRGFHIDKSQLDVYEVSLVLREKSGKSKH